MSILLKNGIIIDGSGDEPFSGSVLIENDRIERILQPGKSIHADRVIDADGLAVTPGFIDIHSHSDLIFTLSPERQRQLLECKIRQGITTEIVGNCGLGVYPSIADSVDAAKAAFAFLTPPGAEIEPGSMEDYLARLESGGLVINAGTLIPHGPVRLATSGLHSRPATAEELKAARDIIESSLSAGALGLSFGLIYPPGIYTSTEEIIELAGPLANSNALATFHQRSGSGELLDDAIEEILTVARSADVHVHLSHEHAQGKDALRGVETLLKQGTRARSEGLRYTQDVIPYTTVQTTLLAVYPPWSLAKGISGWLQYASDPDARKKMKAQIEATIPKWPPWQGPNWPTNIIRDVGYPSIRIAHCPSSPETVSYSLTELSQKQNKEPFDVMTDLLFEAGGNITMSLDGINGTVDDDRPLQILIADPHRAIVSDAWDIGTGNPHPGAYGAFGRLFDRYVRQTKTLTLSQAVRKITSLPAEILNFKDRGTIRPGSFADIVIFDPDKITDRSTQTNPRTFTDGIEMVIVNGKILYQDNKLSNIAPGRLITH